MTVIGTGRGFDPHSRRLFKFIFLFLHSGVKGGVEAKRGINFPNSTRNASKFGAKFDTK